MLGIRMFENTFGAEHFVIIFTVKLDFLGLVYIAGGHCRFLCSLIGVSGGGIRNWKSCQYSIIYGEAFSCYRVSYLIEGTFYLPMLIDLS